MEKFRKTGLIAPIIRVIEEEKFEIPSEIQEKAIPLVTMGKDVIAESATGSGKTLVFAAGIIKDCEHGKGLQTLILTPTRELAEQNRRAMKKFSKYKPLDIIAVYGGVSINPQISQLRRADVVMGTPGRILDHMERQTIDFSRLKILVLDEADRMFDMGFKEDVERIIRKCPVQRQTLLFSATISKDIAHLVQKYMKNPIKVSAENQVDPTKLAQSYYDVPDKQKFSMLVHLLKNERSGLVMVFCNTRKNVDFVVNNLKYSDLVAIAIHGGFSQDKRNRTMDMFHSNKAHVLVCTDVAARGLDIKGVTHIYNYDIPKDSKEYIHRIGRTARAGKEGKAISLLSSWDYDNFTRVLKDNDLKIKKEEMPEIARAQIGWIADRRESRGNFSRGGSRDFSRGSSRGGFSRGSSSGQRSSSPRGNFSRPRRESSSHSHSDIPRGYSGKKSSWER